MVEKLSVAHNVKCVLGVSFLIHNGFICELRAQRVLLVNLIVQADGSGHKLILRRGFYRVVGFPTVVGIVKVVDVHSRASLGVDVGAEVSEQVESVFAVVETGLFLESARIVAETLRCTRFERESETVAHWLNGCDSHHSRHCSVVAGTRRRYNFHILDIIWRKSFQLVQIAHLAVVDVVFGLSAANDFDAAVALNQARNIREHSHSAARARQSCAFNGGNHCAVFQFGFRCDGLHRHFVQLRALAFNNDVAKILNFRNLLTKSFVPDARNGDNLCALFLFDGKPPVDVGHSASHVSRIGRHKNHVGKGHRLVAAVFDCTINCLCICNLCAKHCRHNCCN